MREEEEKPEEALNGTALLLLFKGDKEGVPSLPSLLQSSLNWSAKGRPAHEFLFPANAARSRISIGVPSRCFGWYEMPPFFRSEKSEFGTIHI